MASNAEIQSHGPLRSSGSSSPRWSRQRAGASRAGLCPWTMPTRPSGSMTRRAIRRHRRRSGRSMRASGFGRATPAAAVRDGSDAAAPASAAPAAAPAMAAPAAPAPAGSAWRRTRGSPGSGSRGGRTRGSPDSAACPTLRRAPGRPRRGTPRARRPCRRPRPKRSSGSVASALRSIASRIGGMPGAHGRGARDGAGQARRGDRRRGVARPWPLPGQQLVEDDPEAVDVGRRRRQLAAGLLGAEVVDRAERRAGQRQRGFGERPGDAEVGDLHPAVAGRPGCCRA